jgi:hypothetical protein
MPYSSIGTGKRFSFFIEGEESPLPPLFPFNWNTDRIKA